MAHDIAIDVFAAVPDAKLPLSLSGDFLVLGITRIVWALGSGGVAVNEEADTGYAEYDYKEERHYIMEATVLTKFLGRQTR
jgi:hypothetical protein